ncbi:MAG: redoxin domain-containing protein [Candidatus Binatia bacterium]
MRKFNRISLLIAATLLIVAASSTPSDGSSHRKARPSTADDIFRKLGINKLADQPTAPDFTLRDVQGNSVSLRDLRGRVVFLNFWATWCPPCRIEMPSMERLYRRLRDRGLVMLAVDRGETRKQVATFMKDFQLSFPALLDVDGTVSSLYRVSALPTTYLIDRRGKIIGKKVGPRDWDTRDIEEFFNSLLQGKELPGSYEDPSIVSVPALPFDSALFVKSSEASVYTYQDEHSHPVAKLERGEKLSPLGKASKDGKTWYMVKTQNGAVGWVRFSDVGEGP